MDLKPDKREHSLNLIILQDLIREQKKEIDELREALRDTTASLVAAISLLERGGKKAAPSNKMFHMMIADYQKSVDRVRKTLEKKDEPR